MIHSFTGNYSFLSNFYLCNLYYGDFVYPSAEHLYQACKTTDVIEKIRIKNAATPGQAKRLGQLVTLNPDWDSDKKKIMFNIVWRKFDVHRNLRKWLLETDPYELVEGNTWGDTYWGVCGLTGHNYLGKILMSVRDLCRED